MEGYKNEMKENKSNGRLKEVDVVGGPQEIVYGGYDKAGYKADMKKAEKQSLPYPKGS